MKYRPNRMYYEKNQAADAINNLLIARAPDFGISKIPIEWVSQSNKKDAKLLRIANIQALLVGKRVWFYRNMPGYDKLTQQLLRFPRAGHDDYADALGMACEAPTGYQLESTATQVRREDSNWLHKFTPATIIDDYYDGGCGSGLCC